MAFLKKALLITIILIAAAAGIFFILKAIIEREGGHENAAFVFGAERRYVMQKLPEKDLAYQPASCENEILRSEPASEDNDGHKRQA